MRRYLPLLLVLLAAFLLLPRAYRNRKQLSFAFNVLVFALLAYIAYNIYYVLSRY